MPVDVLKQTRIERKRGRATARKDERQKRRGESAERGGSAGHRQAGEPGAEPRDRTRKRAERESEGRAKGKRKARGKAKAKAKGKAETSVGGKDKRKAKAKTKTNKRVLSARTADKLELYELSVQAPDVDTKFFVRYYKRMVGHPARMLREDFCGTAALACEWVKLHADHHAIGIDLHGSTLDWGRARNVAGLDPDAQERVQLIQDDVRRVREPKADVIAALNFSYCFFTTRAELRGYLENARESLAGDGLLFLDAWGGSETQTEQEERRKVRGFTYVWDQASFDPITYQSVCKIHFEFKDGTRMRDAFVYDWRHWTLPEVIELMTEAGLRNVHVLWEGTDHKTGEGNGVFRRVTHGDADPAWIAYVVGQR